jgi:hypothetical protein
MARTSFMLDKQGYARTQTQVFKTYCFSSATVISERASVLRYTCIVCRGLVCCCDFRFLTLVTLDNSNTEHIFETVIAIFVMKYNQCVLLG